MGWYLEGESSGISQEQFNREQAEYQRNKQLKDLQRQKRLEETRNMKSIKEIFRSWAVVDSEGKHVNGTDKETNHHYGDAYEDIISSIFDPSQLSKSSIARKNVKLMMEIGVADGSSLRAWSEIFPNATCVGLDIHHSDKAHGERIEFYKGNQISKEDCENAARGRLFDVIIEDATHELENSLLTLFWLWPYIQSGGLYIIEELEDIHSNIDRIKQLFPFVEIVDTQGPFGGNEPLVVFRKPI